MNYRPDEEEMKAFQWAITPDAGELESAGPMPGKELDEADLVVRYALKNGMLPRKVARAIRRGIADLKAGYKKGRRRINRGKMEKLGREFSESISKDLGIIATVLKEFVNRCFNPDNGKKTSRKNRRAEA